MYKVYFSGSNYYDLIEDVELETLTKYTKDYRFLLFKTKRGVYINPSQITKITNAST